MNDDERCTQDGAGRMGRCQRHETHEGPHWFEGSPIPPPFFVPPVRHHPGPPNEPATILNRMPFETLVDELIANAMDLGASRAQNGLTSLVDRVAKLRHAVIVRAGPQVSP